MPTEMVSLRNCLFSLLGTKLMKMPLPKACATALEMLFPTSVYKMKWIKSTIDYEKSECPGGWSSLRNTENAFTVIQYTPAHSKYDSNGQRTLKATRGHVDCECCKRITCELSCPSILSTIPSLVCRSCSLLMQTFPKWKCTTSASGFSEYNTKSMYKQLCRWACSCVRTALCSSSDG